MIVETVAAQMDVPPTELSKPLYEVVNPDALNALFEGDNSSGGVVTFAYYGYDVTVTADGDVNIKE